MSNGSSHHSTAQQATGAVQQEEGAVGVKGTTQHQNQAQTSSPSGFGIGSGGFSSSPFGNTLSSPFALKLDRNNYVLWKTMVSTIIRGHRLDGFINGVRQAPPELIPAGVATGDGLPEPNEVSPATSPSDQSHGQFSQPQMDLTAFSSDPS
ncbi:hypothetical protein G4B88_021751 [Cannabis sativa]|uniref:Retrotransposon Copia-like N-terminal domain-containing protein n=1 Tax=Cannabis sativa TaxID=3483 RepID=A0A7J6EYV9_CANSA|nr:hypothetical protein G4B88_021751 [Cannabis sativa]